MTPAVELLADLAGRGIELRAEGGRLRFKPKAAMTPELVERVRARKGELLAMLVGCTPAGPGLAPGTPAGPSTLAWPPTGDDLAARAWRRFLERAVPLPDGRGWYDPGELERFRRLTEPLEAPPAMARPHEETRLERARRWRSEWAAQGYPPGIRPAGAGRSD